MQREARDPSRKYTMRNLIASDSSHLIHDPGNWKRDSSVADMPGAVSDGRRDCDKKCFLAVNRWISLLGIWPQIMSRMTDFSVIHTNLIMLRKHAKISAPTPETPNPRIPASLYYIGILGWVYLDIVSHSKGGQDSATNIFEWTACPFFFEVGRNFGSFTKTFPPQEFPGSSAARTLCFHCQVSGLILVRELRSHKLPSMVRKDFFFLSFHKWEDEGQSDNILKNLTSTSTASSIVSHLWKRQKWILRVD